MPKNPLAAHPPWRQIVTISVVFPAVIALAALAFAWPVGRIGPRDLPVGIVGAGSPAGQQAAAGLHRAAPGGFEVHPYADGAAARSAIRDREVYGAFVVAADQVTVLEASAASPTVGQLLSTTGKHLARSASQRSDTAVASRTVDVVPISPDDPKGLVLSSALLPLTICSVVIGLAIAVLLRMRVAWHRLVALTVVSAAAGLGAYLIAQSFLGALPHEHLASLGALALTILAVGATTAGLWGLLGQLGLGVSAILMVFVGNPFAGVTSDPHLLPDGVNHLGQWLPPGAGANLLRSTAYFGGNDAAGHLTVLLCWVAFGFAAIVIGHRASARGAAEAVSRAESGVETAGAR